MRSRYRGTTFGSLRAVSATLAQLTRCGRNRGGSDLRPPLLPCRSIGRKDTFRSLPGCSHVLYRQQVLLIPSRVDVVLELRAPPPLTPAPAPPLPPAPPSTQHPAPSTRSSASSSTTTRTRTTRTNTPPHPHPHNPPSPQHQHQPPHLHQPKHQHPHQPPHPHSHLRSRHLSLTPFRRLA